MDPKELINEAVRMFQEGRSKEEVVRFLVSKGLKEEDANTVASQIEEKIKGAGPRDGSGPAPGEGQGAGGPPQGAGQEDNNISIEEAKQILSQNNISGQQFVICYSIIRQMAIKDSARLSKEFSGGGSEEMPQEGQQEEQARV